MPAYRHPFLRHATSLCTAACLALTINPASAEKLFDFSFNGTGTTETSGRGATQKLALQLADQDGKAKDVRSADAKGVSGKPGDKALDLTSATGMGAAKTEPQNLGPVAFSAETTDALTELTSFTFSGWMKTGEATPEAVARLICCIFPNSHLAAFDIGANVSPGSLFLTTYDSPQAEVNNRISAYSKVGAYVATGDTWVFFAVTYSKIGEGSLMVTFYTGSQDEPLSRINSSRVDYQISPDPCYLYIGNVKRRNRPFKALLDNIRIHGSKKDATGALTPALLEALRKEDLGGLAKK